MRQLHKNLHHPNISDKALTRGLRKGGGTRGSCPQWLHDSPQYYSVRIEVILDAEINGNLWAFRFRPEPCWMSSQRSTEPLAGGQGVATPYLRTPQRSLPSFLAPMKNPGHALGVNKFNALRCESVLRKFSLYI